MDQLKTWLMGLGAGILTNVLSALVVCVLGILTIRLLMALLKRTLASTKLEKAAHSLIISLARVALYVLLGLMVASALGIDITGIVALASVLTLALSLALQNMLTNVLGGFTLLTTHPFASGDYVEIAGQSGTVQEIGMTYTKLATPDNKIVSIPNSAVVAAEIVNYTVTGTRRLDINLSVSYGVDPDTVLQIMEQAADQPQVLPEPSRVVAMKEYNEQSITYGMMLWCDSADYWDLKFAVNRELSRLAREAGIRFYDPKLSVHLEK